MKNKLSDLNNHLFAQLERLSDEDLTAEQIEQEAKRGEAIVAVADTIVRNAALQIQAAKIAFEGGADPVPYLPAPALRGQQAHRGQAGAQLMRGARIVYSSDEMAWLEEHRMMVISDYHQAFVAAFARDDVTAAHLHGLRKRKGWKVGRDPGRYVGRGRKYSDEEIAWLQENATLPLPDYHAAFVAAFDHPGVTPGKLQSLRKRMGWKTGRTGQYEPGHVPWTQGRTLPFNANSAKTQFKKGRRPQNYRGPGHRSLGDDGYMWIVVDQVNPWTGAKTWRVHEHRWRWERANGPVPGGMALKCLDGDRLNTDPSNWEAVPRGLLPRLNGKNGRNYDAAPAELRPTIMAVAKLEHRVREKRAAE